MNTSNKTETYLKICLLFVGLTLANTANATLRYNITDLGTLGGNQSHGSDINASGQVTGWADTANGSTHAFLTNINGTLTDLGTLGGASSFGNGINDTGQITGYSNIASGSTIAFSTNSSGSMIDLAPPEGGASYGEGINNTGQVTGYADLANGHRRAFVTNDGSMVYLGSPEDAGIGKAINDAGQVVVNPLNGHAFITDITGAVINLDSLGGNTSHGNGINNAGQVTGNFTAADGHQHAFITDNTGAMSDLGTLEHTVIGFTITQIDNGLDINNLGQVVGMSQVVYEGTGGALFYDNLAFVTDNGIIERLDSLLVASVTGWVLNEATGINDLGQITGTGINPNGETRAFLLTPTAVPLPAALWLFSSGLLGVLAFDRKRA